MWLTRLSITRPVTILMLVLTLVILGWLSRNRLPVDLYPDVQFPMLFISTVYPGTGPEEIETLVTKPIEDQLSTIAGLDKLTSTSQESVSTISMQFKLGTPINDVAADVRSKLDALRNRLPQDANAPVVMKLDVGAIPVITLNVGSKSRSSQDVRLLAEDVIKDRLSQVPGVASVNVSGGDVREIRVEVDKGRLEAYNLGINQVVAALQAENLNLPSGTVEEQTRNYAVRVMGEFTDPQQITRVHIPNAAGNPNLLVGDVAIVRDTIAKPAIYTRMNGGDSVMLTVQKQSDGNTVKVVDSVKEELEKLTGKPFTDASLVAAASGRFRPAGTPTLSDDIEVTAAWDQSTFIKDSLHDVYKSLLEGALLAVLIVFLFLHSLRGTMIVALAIPTSMIATFLVMDIIGFSINMMSMLGLSLSVGILVDDSIVVIENIHRHLKMGKPPKEAALAGRTEIGLAAMTITMVDVVVFVPIAFMGGIIGQFFRQFGIVVATATLFSLFISFTLTPMLASRWLKSHEEEEEEDKQQQAHPGLYRRFTSGWERMYGGIEGIYRRVLAWSLEHHAAVIFLGLIVLTASIGTTLPKPNLANPRSLGPMAILFIIMALFALLGTLLSLPRRGKGSLRTGAGKPMWITATALGAFCLLVPSKFGGEFMPQTDQRQFTVTIEEAVGTPLGVTDVMTRKLERELQDKQLFPEIETVSTTVGGSSSSMGFGGGASGSDTASINVELADLFSWFDLLRGKRQLRSTADVMKAINARYRAEPGVKITAATTAHAGPGGSPISIEVAGSDMQRIREVAEQIETIVKQKTPGTTAVELSWREGRPELQAHIDRDRAAQYGLSVAQVASVLRASMEGDTSSKYRELGKEYDIRVSLPERQRALITQVPTLIVGNTTNGQPVYLSQVVRMEPAGGPTKIERSNRQRAVTVNGQLQQGYTLAGVQQAINTQIATLDTRGVSVTWAGQAEEMAKSAKDMLNALLLSIMLVFILMAALFESVLSPLIIGLTVPQAIAGALIALTVTHKSLSVVSAIGFIMLVGLVTKNAILMVDYTNTLRRERGLNRRAALLEAGPTRLRPILMTSLAMIFGMMPTAIALSKGAEMRQPMAIAVIGGLIVALFLSLLMVPTFYEIIDGFGEWYLRMKNRLIAKTHV